MARGRVDPADSMDPREYSRWMYSRTSAKSGEYAKEYIPKRNLETFARERFGSYRECERVVGFSQIGLIVRGQRRLSNAHLLKAAEALNVSPLFLLDLTNDESSKPSGEIIREVAEKRRALHDLIHEFVLTDKPGDIQPLLSHISWSGSAMESPKPIFRYGPLAFEMNPVETNPIDPVITRLNIAREIRHVPGDFRDLNQLACDLLDAYPDTATAMLVVPPFRTS